VAELDSLGGRAFVYHLDRAAAASETSVRALDSATGIWFSGGDQARVTAALAGTPVLRVMQRRYREGAVVGGTSAGAAIMSDSMITGNQTPPGDTTGYYGDEYPAIARHRVEIVPGLGFLPGAIVDQHFIRRERHNRLLSAVLERPSLLGVGIDESTALEVGPDGRWRVLGESAVVIYDARRAQVTDGKKPLLGATGLRVHVLPAGAAFDPRTGGGDL
jgi:cyanophycinase